MLVEFVEFVELRYKDRRRKEGIERERYVCDTKVEGEGEEYVAVETGWKISLSIRL
jgi:hypothetical protein